MMETIVHGSEAKRQRERDKAMMLEEQRRARDKAEAMKRMLGMKPGTSDSAVV
jgi:hypothetical protein